LAYAVQAPKRTTSPAPLPCRCPSPRSAAEAMALRSARVCVVLLALMAALTVASWTFAQPPLSGPTRPGARRPAASGRSVSFSEAKEGAQPAVEAGGAWRVAAALCAALLVALVPVDGAQAARSGGRMGGMGGGMRRGPPPSRAPQQPRSRFGPGMGATARPNISIGVGPVISPMYAPPLFGSPFGLFGPPVVPVPFGGPSNTDQMLQEQQRRDERLLDSQKAEIDALQREIAELKAKKQ